MIEAKCFDQKRSCSRSGVDMRLALACVVLLRLMTTMASAAGDRLWESFPEPSKAWAATHPAKKKGCVKVDDIEMYYAAFGGGDPVLLIHGGLANADVWEAQVAALSPKYQVIVADSRGHGRSTRVAGQLLHYRGMADDYVALLAQLGIEKASVIGWSDGAIIGLDIAMRHPNRVSKLFAQAANSDPSGASLSAGAAWRSYEKWAREDYKRLAGERCGRAGKGDFDGLKAAMLPMWRGEPNWTKADLRKIGVPSAIVLGDRDEAIRCSHTKSMASAIPGARLMILPGVGHFAMRQDPASYNAAVLSFLDGGPPPKLGDCR